MPNVTPIQILEVNLDQTNHEQVCLDKSTINRLSTIAHSHSNIFRRKKSFLFVFGGTNASNNQAETYEVLDIESGIWR